MVGFRKQVLAFEFGESGVSSVTTFLSFPALIWRLGTEKALE